MSSLDDRSWADICDEELYESEARKIIGNDVGDSDEEKFEVVNESIEEGEIRDNSFVTPCVRKSLTNDSANFVSSSTPIRPRSSLTHYEVKRMENPHESTLSYAKVLSRGTPPKGTSSKYQPNVASTDDLSLTSHLDVFHVDSPQKKIDNCEPVLDILVDEDTLMFSPCKSAPNNSVPIKNTKRPFMLIDSPARESRDQAFSFNKIAKSEVNSDVHSYKKPSSNFPSAKRELEVNPEVLCRRQKQIDYGKNTIGYERYSKAVPRKARAKGFPRTPPKHLKMSRRAWDGLIRSWRTKLHKWDPVHVKPEDSDNVNSDQFSVSSEDPSSYDSSSVRSDSTSSTPRKYSSATGGEDERNAWNIDRRQTNDKSDEDDYLGCEPLTENYVKTCS